MAQVRSIGLQAFRRTLHADGLVYLSQLRSSPGSSDGILPDCDAVHDQRSKRRSGDGDLVGARLEIADQANATGVCCRLLGYDRFGVQVGYGGIGNRSLGLIRDVAGERSIRDLCIQRGSEAQKSKREKKGW